MVSEAVGPGRCAQLWRALTEVEVIGHARVPFAVLRCRAVRVCLHVEHPCTSASGCAWAGTNCCGSKGPGLWPSYTGARWARQELPSMHSPSAPGPWKTFWLWCSSYTEYWLPASRLRIALGWAKTASVPLVQPGRWLSWCLLVLLCCMRLPPITRQRSLNPSRCSKWRSDIFMWELLRLEWREELIGIFCNLALISACFCPKLRPQPPKRDECFSKNTETYRLKSFSE